MNTDLLPLTVFIGVHLCLKAGVEEGKCEHEE
jgi:hypothetical protein